MTASTIEHSRAQQLADSAGALFTKKDLAEFFAVSCKSIDRWIAAGDFPPPDVRLTKRTIRWRAATIRPILEKRGRR